MKYIDKWWSDQNIDLVEVNDTIYALNGWNGEKYTDCWKCIDKFTAADDKTYTLTPVYRFERDNIDIAILEENSPEWCAAFDIVDFLIVQE